MAITIQQFITKQNQRIAELKKGVPLAKAAATVHAVLVQRVFREGKTAFDTKIGTYNSSTPLYVNPNRSPRKLPTTGKHGQKIFTTGKKKGQAHKTTYYSSYKDFRSRQGRESSFVNLVLFGNLQSDFSNSLQEVNANKWIAGTKREENTNKMNGAEKKYGEIFSLTKEENELFQETAREEFLRIMTQ